MSDHVQAPESGEGEGAVQPAAEPVKPDALTEQPKDQNSVDTKPEGLQQPKLQECPDTAPKEIPIQASSDIKTENVQDKVEQTPVPTEPPKSEEIKPETSEVKPTPASENKDATQVENKNVADSKPEENGAASIPSQRADWQSRETALLKKIEELEKVKEARTKDSVMLELKVREEEIDLLKARVKNLETELQAALSKPSGKNHEMIQNIKQQHEELLSKARGMIFDKTKMVKNQELQIEALTTQIQSLKDINQITKDLLEIRNSEVKAMEDRLVAMEARFKAEKDRYGLVLQRAQTSSNINDDLRKEYETQLKLFKELREKYDQRVQALVAENERLKASLNPSGGAPSSG